MTKAKKFSKKLLSLLLAVLMAISCFTGAVSTYAETSAKTKYHDKDLAYNFMAWAETTDEQTATALLDYLDTVLAGVALPIDLDLNVVVAQISIHAKLDSVNGIFDLIAQIENLLYDLCNAKLAGIPIKLGALHDVNITQCFGDRTHHKYSKGDTNIVSRENTSSKDMLMRIVELINANFNDIDGKNVIQNFVRGEIYLGQLTDILKVDIYNILGGALGMSAGWQNNMVYNIVKQLLVNAFYIPGSADHTAAMGKKIEQIACDLLNTKVFDTIIAYDTTLMFKDANFKVNVTDNLNDKAVEAFKIVWEHTLEPLIGTIAYDHFGYTRAFYEYINKDNKNVETFKGVTKQTATVEKVTEWINSADFDTAFPALKDIKTVDEFKKVYNFDRTTLGEDENQWKNIDSVHLFNKVLYDPLADALGIKTGVLNLGIKFEYGSWQKFVKEFTALNIGSGTKYTTIANTANDFIADLASKIFIKGCPELTMNSAADSYNSIVPNVLKVVQYVADATDKNILNKFYTDKGQGTALTEENIEEAMVPFLISVLKASLEGFGLINMIHDSEWNACATAEDVAFVCLKENLSFSLPNRDYSTLPGATINPKTGKYAVTLEGTLLPMCRDAVAYVMGGLVPIDMNGTAAGGRFEIPSTVQTYEEQVSTKTTLFDILNAVVCTYAEDHGVASLLGFHGIGEGHDKISRSNTLWQNIDIIANGLLPQLGQLFGVTGSDGIYTTGTKIDSKALIYDGVVKGALNIADKKTLDGKSYCGISYFINMMGKAFSSEIFTSEQALKVVYDLLKNLFNFVLSDRTSDGLGNMIPDAESEYMFDDLLQKDVIVGNESSPHNIGVLGRLVHRIYRAFGGVKGGVDYSKDTAWKGAMYLVSGINNIVTFIPQLDEHKLGLVSAKVSAPIIKNATGTVADTLTITNETFGLNNAYVDKNGKVVQDSRYSVKLKSLTSDNSIATVEGFSEVDLAPEETKTYTVNVSAPSEDTAIKLTVKYDIYKDGKAIYSDLESFAYIYCSTKLDWHDTVYEGENSGTIKSDYHLGSPDQSNQYTQSSSKITEGGLITKKQMFALTTKDILVKESKLGNMGIYGQMLINNASDSALDGIFTVDPSDHSKATPSFDKDGNLINYTYIDWKDADGNWHYAGDNNRVIRADGQTEIKQSGATYTFDTLPASAVDTRPHIAYTYDKASNTYTSTVSTYSYNISNVNVSFAPDGSCEKVTVNPENRLYNNFEGSSVSWATPIKGLNVSIGYAKYGGGAKHTISYLHYDGTTKIATTANQKMCVAFANTNNGNIAYADQNLHFVADVDCYNRLMQSYNDAVSFAAKYRASDFSTPSVYTNLLEQVKKTLGTSTTPVTLDNALNLEKIYADAAADVKATIDECNKQFKKENLTQIIDKVTNVINKLDKNDFDMLSYQKLMGIASVAQSMLIIDRYNNYYKSTDVTNGVANPGAKPLFSCLASQFNVKYQEYAASNPEAVPSTFITGVEDSSKNVYSTNASTTQIEEAIKEFNTYLSKLIDRGFVPDKLKAEVLCASGNDYTALKVTEKGIEAPTAKYGSVKDGVIANEKAGKKAYTDESWKAYIDALTAAVNMLNTPSSAVGYTSDYYNPEQADNYALQISDVYNTRKALMIAENKLTPFVEEAPTGFSVSAVVTVMSDSTGATNNTPIKNAKITLNNGISAVTGADGRFTLQNVPAGNYTATITYDYGITRNVNVTVTDHNVDFKEPVALVSCDFDKNGLISSADSAVVDLAIVSDNAIVNYPYCDLDGNNLISSADSAVVNMFTMDSVQYKPITIK